jgi:hypothetical protein
MAEKSLLDKYGETVDQVVGTVGDVANKTGQTASDLINKGKKFLGIGQSGSTAPKTPLGRLGLGDNLIDRRKAQIDAVMKGIDEQEGK